ncbi:uncharacterized protein LOC128223286 [Mya arenaria]|uniref:uncharacterized protein LOC128223286 n=1 Tax=Mya arenaria TaxID=6604 RepID=UPI0022E398C5|nr:uncharacterized protein LOC128223286 [Mya arenaria]
MISFVCIVFCLTGGLLNECVLAENVETSENEPCLIKGRIDEQSNLVVVSKRDNRHRLNSSNAKDMQYAIDGRSFEDFEKAYYINRTMTYLQQIYCYKKEQEESIAQDQGGDETAQIEDGIVTARDAKPVQVTTKPSFICDTDFRTEPALESMLHELREIPPSQMNNLTEIMNQARMHAATGQTDVADISSLCCNLGG